MFPFAIALMLGLGIVSVAMLGESYIAAFERTGLRAGVLILLGVGASWLADFSLWAAWDVAVRADWIGIALTGLALAGVAQVWYGLFRVMSGIQRKFHDEAASLEQEKGLRRVA